MSKVWVLTMILTKDDHYHSDVPDCDVYVFDNKEAADEQIRNYYFAQLIDKLGTDDLPVEPDKNKKKQGRPSKRAKALPPADDSPSVPKCAGRYLKRQDDKTWRYNGIVPTDDDMKEISAYVSEGEFACTLVESIKEREILGTALSVAQLSESYNGPRASNEDSGSDSDDGDESDDDEARSSRSPAY